MKKPLSPRVRTQAVAASRRRPLSPVIEFLEDRTVPAARFVQNELLVQYLPGTDALTRQAVRGTAHARLAETIHTAAMKASGEGVMERWILPSGLGVKRAAQTVMVRATPVVAFAEPNWIHTTAAVSNDPYYTTGSRLWGMYSDDTPTAIGPSGTTNQYGTWAEKAWDAGFTGNRDVYIGVIDEGIQWNHPDLVNNMWVNPFETPGDGIDNDGNGYIDDIRGWDFFNNDNSIYDGTGDDHGTHVAGTIGAEGGNGQGVAGVNWDVTMISAKFLQGSGSTANAVKSVDYFTDLKARHGLNIVATSNSWGGGGSSTALLNAIVRGAQAGILFVAAAGNANNNNDVTPFWPANYNTTAGAGYDAVISVASITNTGARSSFSSYGRTTVDLGAPGSSIWSTVPNNSYANYQGTSMATPHVSGAIALYASRYADATAQEIRNAILTTATPTASLNNITVTGGRLNVWNAINRPPRPTMSITDVSVTEGNTGTVQANFTVSLSQTHFTTVSAEWDTFDDTATAGSDYVAGSGTVTFAPGETTKTVSVTVNGDFLVEPDETFGIMLSNFVNADNTNPRAIGTIVNDDVRTEPDITISDVTVQEGNGGTSLAVFTVSLSNASSDDVFVDWATADDTATEADSDYVGDFGQLHFRPGQTEQTVAITINGDLNIEPDETFAVNLANAVNAQIVKFRGIGTIVNDDSRTEPDITISDVSVQEGSGGTSLAVFTVSLSGPATGDVFVDWATADDTATEADSDYVGASGQIQFRPGETEQTVAITINGDLNFEPDETFTVNLSNPVNGQIVKFRGIGTIVNDDTEGKPTIFINDVSLQEGDTGAQVAVFNVVLSAPFAQAITVDYVSRDGGATAGEDYEAVAGTLRFSPGQTSQTIAVTVYGDYLFEQDEDFFISLFDAVNAEIGNDQGTGLIFNDDAERVEININSVTVTEGNSGVTLATLTVSLTDQFGQAVLVDFGTRDGTALSRLDYNNAAGTLRFSPGETVKTVTVEVIADTTREPNEQFFVDLFNPVNATVGTGTGTVTIINDDHPTILELRIRDSEAIEGNTGITLMTFTATLNRLVEFDEEDARFTWTTADGSATVANNDYIPATGTVTFARDSLTATFTVEIVGDRDVEPDEQFSVFVTSTNNSTPVDQQGIGIIRNDDGVGGPPGGGGPPPGFLMADGPALTAGGANSLRQNALNRLARAAQSLWVTAGLNAAQLRSLSQVQVRVADLPGNVLGMAEGNVITIDRDAAGHGWFVDVTPWNSREFTRPGNQGEQGRMDLLSVVLHEMGHVVGLDHDDHGVMSATLAAGTRDLSSNLRPGTGSLPSAADALFSQWKLRNQQSQLVALLSQAVSRRM